MLRKSLLFGTTAFILAVSSPFISASEAYAYRMARSIDLHICTPLRGGKLNMRRGPGIGYRRITQLWDQTRITVLGFERNGGGETWYRVETMTGDRGWVHGNYVCR